MTFIADSKTDSKLWEYIVGDFNLKDDYEGIYDRFHGCSIPLMRYYYFEEQFANKNDNFSISLRDIENNRWTKWERFPSKLLYRGNITPAVDVHRSVMPNEIVIESDYPEYIENYKAAQLIGEIIEKKGFKPHYYYSGNKSVHVHVYIDDLFLSQVPGNSKENFMQWIREKMISCWDTNLKQFDRDLINPRHLIRAELSKNKKGYKTFLGYTFKDLSPIPIICNEQNRIYPRLAKIKQSFPSDPIGLIDEFFADSEKNRQIALKKKKTRTRTYIKEDYMNKVRVCVGLILDDEFKSVGDGFSRAMFIIVNELRRIHNDEKAKELVHDWNNRMNNPIREADIDYRFKLRSYNLSCKYIHEFLKEIGIDASKKC